MHYKPHVLFSVKEVVLMHALQASCLVQCGGGGANAISLVVVCPIPGNSCPFYVQN